MKIIFTVNSLFSLFSGQSHVSPSFVVHSVPALNLNRINNVEFRFYFKLIKLLKSGPIYDALELITDLMCGIYQIINAFLVTISLKHSQRFHDSLPWQWRQLRWRQWHSKASRLQGCPGRGRGGYRQVRLLRYRKNSSFILIFQ